MINNRRDFLRVSGLGGLGLMSGGLLAGERTEDFIANDFLTVNLQAPTMKSFKIAAISNRCVPAAPEKNLANMDSWLTKAKDKGAELVCFPELNITGYVLGPLAWKFSEPVPGGPSIRALEEKAKRYNVIIAAGIAEQDRGIVYDTYVFVGPDGYIGKSRKMHIPPAEVSSWRGGGVAPVIDIGLAKVGVNICFDNWLPESSRLVALQGAEVILAPFVWGKEKAGTPAEHLKRNQQQKEYTNRTFPARAIDNGTFVVFYNDWESVVLIYSPEGKVIAESPDEAFGDIMVVAELDQQLLFKRRSQNVFHPRFRRPELYGILAEGDIGRQDPR